MTGKDNDRDNIANQIEACKTILKEYDKLSSELVSKNCNNVKETAANKISNALREIIITLEMLNK